MDIKDLRVEIDNIDRQLVELFCRRMDIAKKVAQYKKENSLPVLDEKREEEKLLEISKAAGEDMAEYAKELYEHIFAMSRAEQEKYIAANRGNTEEE